MSGVRYFAYGSNLLRERLLARCPGLVFSGLATLTAHRLTFDKASTDGSGKCAFEPADASEVLGVLWDVPDTELAKLDRAEGVGYGYERCQVTVQQADRESEVLTYQTTNRQAGLQPYDWYLALVLAGAEQQGMPPEYIDRLRTTPFRFDPDTNRRTRCTALAALEEAGMMEVLHGLA